MRLDADELWLSPTDLGTHLECHHATALALAAARGDGPAAAPAGEYAELLFRKGREHEREHLDALRAGRAGEVEEVDVDGRRASRPPPRLTDRAMRAGAEVIYQGAFSDGRLAGPGRLPGAGPAVDRRSDALGLRGR